MTRRKARAAGRPRTRPNTASVRKHRKHMQIAHRDAYRTPEGRIRALLAAAKHRAKKKGIPFSLTEDMIFIPQLCPLEEIPITLTVEDSDNSPSLDRIDSGGGYTPDNVWVVSRRANRRKNDATLEELERICRNWRRHLEERRECIQGLDDARHGVDPGKVPVVRGGGADGH